MMLEARTAPELPMRMAAPASSKDIPAMKIDRAGHTWAENRKKIEQAARVATEAVKAGKSRPPPVKRP
ncbi:MAG TPA: hypothetical protein VND95_03405 [Stellaceae bacterium]|nr:hypothetical protein [Stellaceae bacterium]